MFLFLSLYTGHELIHLLRAHTSSQTSATADINQGMENNGRETGGDLRLRTPDL